MSGYHDFDCRYLTQPRQRPRSCRRSQRKLHGTGYLIGVFNLVDDARLQLYCEKIGDLSADSMVGSVYYPFCGY